MRINISFSQRSGLAFMALLALLQVIIGFFLITEPGGTTTQEKQYATLKFQPELNVTFLQKAKGHTQ
ncbi:MAG: hypothetical protein ACRBDL_10765 [Alphaproteobacteria bacterium]